VTAGKNITNSKNNGTVTKNVTETKTILVKPKLEKVGDSFFKDANGKVSFPKDLVKLGSEKYRQLLEVLKPSSGLMECEL